jgi:hypothetical protein
MNRLPNLTAALLVVLLFASAGCNSDHYLIHDRTQIEEVEVEVPIYIEVEVPTDPENSEVWVDSFNQPTSVDGVDILWVIDTSGSMHHLQDELLDGIDAMLSNLPPHGWRLVMMSNSPDKSIQEQQFPLVPGDDIIDAENMYTAMYVGHHEKGFDATYEYIISNPYASTWMRQDAALLVVFVSDEEEQSNSHFSAVQDFISWYSALRTSVFLASIVNLEPSLSLCSSNDYNTGDRYIEATNHFGGVIVDICTDDWSTGVTDASVQIEPYEEWTLSHIPVAATIRVFIDTQLNSDWTYDAADNKVIFTVIPPGGSHVEIGYVIDATPGDDDDSGSP